jgi:hypothetical protein
MTQDDGLKGEMPMPPPRRDVQPEPAALDERTAERLLAGRLGRAETPPGYARVAELLGAAAGPAAPGELAGEDAALAAFRSAIRPTPIHARRSRRQPPRTRRFALKLAAAAVLVVLSLAGAAGATGTLPEPAQRVVHKVLGVAGVPGPDQSGSNERHPATSHGPNAPGGPGSTAPGENGQGHGRGPLAPPTSARGQGQDQGNGEEPGQDNGGSNSGGNGKGQGDPEQHGIGPKPKSRTSATGGNASG